MKFSEYKEKVSIVHILEDLGYVPDISKGRATPVYVKIINGKKVDEVMVKNPNSLVNQVYYDRNYQGGDVISFIKNHLADFPQFYHTNEYVQINQILRHYSNTPYVPKYQHFKLNAEKTPFELERYKILETKTQHLDYLILERKISEEVLERFLPFIVRVQDTQSKYKFANIGFPYHNPAEGWGQITNFELRNYDFKGMAIGGDKINSVWVAMFSTDNKQVKNVFVAESAIDAISFYELNQENFDFSDSCFCSVGGYITENQINNILKAFPKAQIHTCFDSDLAGILYDIRVHSALMNYKILLKKENENIIFQVNEKTFSIHCESINLGEFSKKMNDIILIKIHKPQGGKDFNEILKQSKK